MRVATWFAASLVVLVMLMIAYVLSLGPLLGLNERGYISGHNLEWMETTHAPIFAVAERWRVAATALDSYLTLWRPTRPPQPPRRVTAPELRALGFDVEKLGDKLPPVYAVEGKGWIMQTNEQTAPLH